MSNRTVRAVVLAAAAGRLSYAALRARPPGGAQTWDRTNHRGEPITLLEGPAVAIGGIAGALAGDVSARVRIALAIAGAGGAAFGSYDDLEGNGASKGFRGHLGALRKGELTTGAIKIAGIGATGLAAALIAGPPPGAGDAGDGTPAAMTVADTLINAGLVAGGANLLNLFDLRPGRAIKVALLTGALLAPSRNGRAACAPALAAAAALLPEDLGERSMLGDAGANALGAMLGAAAAATLPRGARLGALAVVLGLTAASEKVSFTKVIERTGPLRRLDMLGRRPAGQRAEPTEAVPNPAPPRPRTARSQRQTGARPRRGDRPGRPGHPRRSGSRRRIVRSVGHWPRRCADRGAYHPRQVAWPGPNHRVRQDRWRHLPGHRLRHRKRPAEHHLRHRPRRRADQHHGARPGQARWPVGRRSGRGGRGPADVISAADLDDDHPRAGEPGDRAGGRPARAPAQPG